MGSAPVVVGGGVEKNEGTNKDKNYMAVGLLEAGQYILVNAGFQSSSRGIMHRLTAERVH